jgi:CHRD domain
VHSMKIRSALCGVAVAACLSASSIANAETVKFKATMDASQEVPPNDSKGKGTADLTYDTTSKELTWRITFDGLTGPATAAHFHGPAEPGKNADVAVPIGKGTVTSPITGKATLTDAQAADLMAGRWYVNLHTAANKGGEIRGQVTK